VQRERRREVAAGDAADAEGARQGRQLRDLRQLQHLVEGVGVAVEDEAIGRDAVSRGLGLRARLRDEGLGRVHLERAAHVAELVVLADRLDVDDLAAADPGQIEVQVVSNLGGVEPQEVAGRVRE
jgi:hypothetical protein